MEHESDGDTKKGLVRVGARRVKNRSMRRDHPNNRTSKIGQNTEKSPGDLRRLAIIAMGEMVICLTLYFLGTTNELRNFALTTQQRKFFICSFEYLVCFWCCKTRGV